jgi:long-chain acyl-CoA synthetase
VSGPATLPACLLRHARERPDDVALRKKDMGRWQEWTWAEYEQRVARVAAGLRACGVQPGDRIAIQSENRPEWLVADVAAQAIGAVVVGVYPTSPAAELEYLMRHSGSKLLIAEDEEQVDKALAVRADLPDLGDVFVMDARGVREGDARRWEELERTESLDLEAAAASLDPEDTAIIVYTSGTTGPPKGAMLSHQNMLYAARSFRGAYDSSPEDEVLSYLPLCHIAERLFSVLGALEAGYVVNFGAGGESFPADLREVQPTLFLGVPRVWEKMLATVEVRMADASRLKRLLWRAALARGGFVGHLLAFRALREKLGLLRVRAAISGAAPIAPQVLEFFARIGVHVREGYGQTEGTAVATATPEGGIRIGTVGTALPDVELKISDDGEILIRSPGVFKGYFRDEEATAQTVDAEGWLHTGDVGELDADGYLTITDRKKDIIITAGGKNISPSEIENKLKVSPYVREAIVIGDRRKYLTALIGIELDTVADWAGRRGLTFTTYGDLASKEPVRELIGEWVERVNGELAQVERVKRFELLRKELDHEDGQLTATQKVKRAAISQEFADEVEALYS